MTYLEAAFEILRDAAESLHYGEIAQRALDRELITPTGRTPAATMGSRLYTDTLKEETQFARAGRGIFALAQTQPSGIDAQVRAINMDTRERLRSLLSTVPPERFEALITELLLQMGFDENTVTVTPYGNDGGIDVTGVYHAAGLTEVNAAVQVKRWKRNIQAPVVTQLRGSLQVHQQGIIITTSDFSKGARTEAGAANKTRIGLINGDELLDLLFKHRVGVTEKTLRVLGLDDEWWGEVLGKDVTDPVDAPAPSLVAQPKLLRGPTGRKPDTITLLGQTHAVSSWKGVLMTACTVLAAHHRTVFDEQVTAIRGRKRHYFATTPEGMHKAEPIPGTALWVETNLSAQAIVTLVRQVLTVLGHAPDDWAVGYGADSR